MGFIPFLHFLTYLHHYIIPTVLPSCLSNHNNFCFGITDLYSSLKHVFSSLTLSLIDEVCSSCEFYISAKMHKHHLNKIPIVSTSVLDIVHNDVWGPSPITSLLGFNYYVIFVDDYTRFT